VPNWLSTHPAPAARAGRAEPVAGKYASAAATRINRDQYQERIAGLVFGDNPKDGIVRGNVFLHPMLRIGLEFPDGWDVTNSADAVLAQEPGSQHFMVLQEVEQPRLLRPGSGGQGQSIADAAVAAMRKAGYTVVEGRMERINGLEAHVGLYRGTAKDVGKVTMRAAHISIGRQMYVVAGFAPEAGFDRVDRELQTSLKSFRELSANEAAQIRPNRLDFYVVRQGDSWQSIAARQGKGIVNAATLAIMNDREVHVQPHPGDRVKIVVAGV
jgi:predicted Zn-dependent protease